jgi:hypothetical protein
MTKTYVTEYFIHGWVVVDTSTGVRLTKPTTKNKCLAMIRRLDAKRETPAEEHAAVMRFLVGN